MANSKLTGKRTINGKFGKVWWDGELLAEIQGFEAKMSINREEVAFVGEMVPDSKITGVSIEGTLKLKKVYSRGQKKLVEAYLSGKDPRSKIVAGLDDPDAYGAERVSLGNVWFNEVTLMAFENNTLGEEELPFGCTDVEYLDLIDSK